MRFMVPRRYNVPVLLVISCQKKAGFLPFLTLEDLHGGQLGSWGGLSPHQPRLHWAQERKVSWHVDAPCCDFVMLC